MILVDISRFLAEFLYFCLPCQFLNLILPIPYAWDVPDTPLTLVFGDSFMSPMNTFLSLQTWNVAQLSIASSVG